jgi:hypothetical protein
MFYTGQKVVCVNDDKTNNKGVKELKKGEIYTIRWCGVFDGPYTTTDRNGKGVSVRLFEVKRRRDEAPFQDYPFKSSRFKPLVERKTDISVLEKLLLPVDGEKVG